MSTKILNRDLNLRLIKKRTLPLIFKILNNESLIKSRELDLNNRFIFDNFFKKNTFNKFLHSILIKDKFYSSIFFFKMRFFYFFFNFNFFIDFYNYKESLKYWREFLNKGNFSYILLSSSKNVNRKFKKNSLISSQNFLVGTNLSFIKFSGIFNSFAQVSKLQKKDVLHEEGKKLFSQELFFFKIASFRVLNRNFQEGALDDIMKCFQQYSNLKLYLYSHSIIFFFQFFIFIFLFFQFFFQFFYSYCNLLNFLVINKFHFKV